MGMDRSRIFCGYSLFWGGSIQLFYNQPSIFLVPSQPILDDSCNRTHPKRLGCPISLLWDPWSFFCRKSTKEMGETIWDKTVGIADLGIGKFELTYRVLIFSSFVPYAWRVLCIDVLRSVCLYEHGLHLCDISCQDRDTHVTATMVESDGDKIWFGGTSQVPVFSSGVKTWGLAIIGYIWQWRWSLCYLVEVLLGLDLQGENPRFGLRWLDLSTTATERRSLSEGVYVGELFTLYFWCLEVLGAGMIVFVACWILFWSLWSLSSSFVLHLGILLVL